MRQRLVVLLGLLSLLAGASATSGFADPSRESGKQRAAVGGLIIKPGRYGVTRLGHFHPGRDASLGAALRAFGKPSHIRRGGLCKLNWREKRLKINFANYGGHSACSKRYGQAQKVVIRRSGRWRTTRHLTVGHSTRRLERLYPRARNHGAYWWLKTAVSHLGTTHRYPVLAARVRNRHVIGFKGWIGAAGE
jgi:hypothetical protein